MLSHLAGAYALAVATVLAAAALFPSACGDDDDHAASIAVSSNAEITAPLDFLDEAGLHDIETSINNKGEIPATARTVAIRTQAVVLVTVWPKGLQAGATKLAGIFGDMAKSLDGEKPNVKVAGPAAKAAHDGEHDFSGRRGATS